MSLELSSDSSKWYEERVLDAIYKQILPNRMPKPNINSLMCDLLDAWKQCYAYHEYDDCEIISAVANKLIVLDGSCRGSNHSNGIALYVIHEINELQYRLTEELKRSNTPLCADAADLDTFLDSFSVKGGDAV
jgi:hypothetical protein